jgi:hypothetical protein
MLCALRIWHLALLTTPQTNKNAAVSVRVPAKTVTVPVKTVKVPVRTEKSKAFQKLERTHNWF